MYFRRRSITRRAFVSKTTKIISCDAPTSPKLWFSLLTFVTYLGNMEFGTRSGPRLIATGYQVPKPDIGNAASESVCVLNLLCQILQSPDQCRARHHLTAAVGVIHCVVTMAAGRLMYLHPHHLCLRHLRLR